MTVASAGCRVPENRRGNFRLAESTSQAAAGSADHPRANRRVRAHDTAVGMPSDEDMDNSAAGHKAISAGQAYAQGAVLVADAIASGANWDGPA